MGPTASCWPSAARSRPARTTAAVAVLVRRAQQTNTTSAALTGLQARLAAHARPAPISATMTSCLTARSDRAMHDPGYCAATAFLDDQSTVPGDWSPHQYITVQLSDDADELDRACCALTSQQAHDLAFGLLVLAEHADRRAEGLT